MTTEKEIAEEEVRLKTLQRIVDLALFYISAVSITKEDAEQMVEKVRKKALQLFPDKGETFDLIYLPRFRRVMTEKYGLH